MGEVQRQLLRVQPYDLFDAARPTLSILMYVGARLLCRGISTYDAILAGEVALSESSTLVVSWSHTSDRLLAVSGLSCILSAFFALWDINRPRDGLAKLGDAAYVCSAIGCGALVLATAATFSPLVESIVASPHTDEPWANSARRLQVSQLGVARILATLSFASLTVGFRAALISKSSNVLNTLTYTIVTERIVASLVFLPIIAILVSYMAARDVVSNAAFAVDFGNLMVVGGVLLCFLRNPRIGGSLGLSGLAIDAGMRFNVEGSYFFRLLTSWSIAVTVLGIVLLGVVRSYCGKLFFPVAANSIEMYTCQAFRSIGILLALGFTLLIVVYDGSMAFGTSSSYLQYEDAWGPRSVQRLRRDLITSATCHYGPAILWIHLHPQVTHSSPQKSRETESTRAMQLAASFAFAAVVADVLSAPDSSIQTAATGSMRLSAVAAIGFLNIPTLYTYKKDGEQDAYFRRQLILGASVLVAVACIGTIAAPITVRVAEALGLLITIPIVVLPFGPKPSLPWPKWSPVTLLRVGVFLTPFLLASVWFIVEVVLGRGFPQEYGLTTSGSRAGSSNETGTSTFILSVVVFAVVGVLIPYILAV